MGFIQATANEFLVTSRAGRLTNRGAGGSALLLPGATWVKVSGAKQEACFAMTQESRDGIPLRFKGIVIYRVVDPVAAVRSFRFAGDDGHRQRSPDLVFLGLDDLLAAVVARRRDVVAQVRFARGGLDRGRRLAEVIVRAMHPALRRGLLVLLDGHGNSLLKFTSS